MNDNNIFLTVVIPQYNEISNLSRGVLDQVNDYLSTKVFNWEVIIADDGSNDGSLEFSRKFASAHEGFKVIKGSHGGKAIALNNGINDASGELLLFTDMDQSTPISYLDSLLFWVDKGFDVIIGSRGQKRNNSSIFRKIASFSFSTFRRTILLHSINDTQCGFKLFKVSVAKEIFPILEAVMPAKVEGWKVSAFDVELLFIAQKRGYKIKEVTVDWNDEDTSNTKERKFIKESIDMLKQILKVRVNSLKGKYNK